jgi:hypothetical protein
LAARALLRQCASPVPPIVQAAARHGRRRGGIAALCSVQLARAEDVATGACRARARARDRCTAFSHPALDPDTRRSATPLPNPAANPAQRRPASCGCRSASLTARTLARTWRSSAAATSLASGTRAAAWACGGARATCGRQSLKSLRGEVVAEMGLFTRGVAPGGKRSSARAGWAGRPREAQGAVRAPVPSRQLTPHPTHSHPRTPPGRPLSFRTSMS